MMLQKWNFKTHEYEPFTSPAKLLIIYTQDMTLKIDCANCGDGIMSGDCYTSRTIHNRHGLGYPVCEGCYEKEVDDEKGAK